MNDKLMAELLLEIKELKALLGKFVEQPPSSDAEEWLIGRLAWEKLTKDGVRSESHLKRLRLIGVFSEKKGEIRNVSEGDRPTWEYNIPKCKPALKRYFERISA